MRISRLRNAVLGVLVTVGLLPALAASGAAAAAPVAVVTFGATAVPGTPPVAPAHACTTGAATCASNDPKAALAWSSTVATTGCTFRLVLDWGDGTPAQTVRLTGKAAPGHWQVGHTYRSGVSARKAYAVRATGTVLADRENRGCRIASTALTFTLLCTTGQLSGPAWNTRWPGGDRDVEHLNPTFRPKVKAFTAAMTRAGITVQPQSTLRSPQRAHLMHYSYRVAKGLIRPDQVPGYTALAGEKGPQVCWTHRTRTGRLDVPASVAAARQLLGALGVDASLRTPPGLRSRHTTGDAIDMRTQWTARSVTIADAAGRPVRIASTPRDGTNAQLVAVGATYGVRHFSPVAVDRNHWSSDGR